MGKGNFYGQMGHLMKVSFWKIISMDLELMNGMMGEYIKENGKIIKCMGKVLLPGEMAENILEIT